MVAKVMEIRAPPLHPIAKRSYNYTDILKLSQYFRRDIIIILLLFIDNRVLKGVNNSHRNQLNIYCKSKKIIKVFNNNN